jgi:hypothetical protein
MKPIEIVYLVPSDCKVNPRYIVAINDVLAEVQLWFYGALGGRSFQFTNILVESSRLLESDFGKPFEGRENPTFWRAFDEVNRIRGVAKPGVGRIIFVDAPGVSGAGIPGTCILPRHDLLAYLTPLNNRGGLAHEVGHLFGLDHSGPSHPDALMQFGYGKFPFTYLTEKDYRVLDTCAYLKSLRSEELALQRPIYCYSEGRFVSEKGRWYEIFSKNGSHIPFQEVAGEGNYRYLKDPIRDLTLRLPENGGWAYWTTPKEGAWRALYVVRR